MNAELIVQLILGLLDRGAAYAALLTKAKAENRDVTDAELATLLATDDAARAALDAAIAQARNNP